MQLCLWLAIKCKPRRTSLLLVLIMLWSLAVLGLMWMSFASHNGAQQMLHHIQRSVVITQNQSHQGVFNGSAGTTEPTVPALKTAQATTTTMTVTSRPPSPSTTEWMLTYSENTSSALMKRLWTDFPDGGRRSPQFQSIYNACAKSNVWGTSKTPINHVTPYPYIHQATHLCIGKIDLLIVIHTDPQRSERRHLIRSTWGALRQVRNHRIVIAFFSGGGLKAALQNSIDQEVLQYGDIIQRDFVDNYRNLTLKHLTVLEWTLQHCKHAQHLLKVDDDTFVDPFHVLQFVSLHPPQAFVCRTINSAPIRTHKTVFAKWYVSTQEYPEKQYPTYCEGFAYLLDVREVKRLFWCSVFTQFFWIDDVFVTGLLANRLGLHREMFWKGHSFDWMRPSHASDSILDYMLLSIHENVIFEQTYQDIWRSVLQRQTAFL